MVRERIHLPGKEGNGQKQIDKCDVASIQIVVVAALNKDHNLELIKHFWERLLRECLKGLSPITKWHREFRKSKV